MIVYGDIDGTICKPYKKDGHVDPDYRDAEPIPENIEKINKLFNLVDILQFFQLSYLIKSTLA